MTHEQRMSERLAKLDRRYVDHDEEGRELKKFLTSLRKRGWKRHEVEAAHSGWEWAFDTGYDQDCDEDAARAMADGVMDEEDRKWRASGGKEACADYIFTGIQAARKLQEIVDAPVMGGSQ